MAYSKGVIAIPEVTGNIVITVTTEAAQLVNLFDSSTASYNYRINSSGSVITSSAAGDSSKGAVVTAPIDITDISTLTIQGITEVADKESNYLKTALYSGSAGDNTVFLKVNSYKSALYTIDVAAYKTQYPTATYIRLQIPLSAGSASSISSADTANLAIYGT